MSNLVQKQSNKHNSSFNGRWTKKEHQDFIEAIQKYGKNWKMVEKYVKTRSGTQIRSHAQKFFNRMERQFKKHRKTEELIRQNMSDGSLECSQTESQVNKLILSVDQPIKKVHRHSMDDELVTQNRSSYELMQNEQHTLNVYRQSIQSSFFNTIVNQFGSDLFENLYKMVQINTQDSNQAGNKERSISFIEFTNKQNGAAKYRKRSLNEALLNNQY